MKHKKEYQNLRTGKIKEIEVALDETGHAPMYITIDGVEWKAVPKWALKVVNSSYFFESAHKNMIKHTAPPLDGSDMPYGLS